MVNRRRTVRNFRFLYFFGYLNKHAVFLQSEQKNPRFWEKNHHLQDTAPILKESTLQLGKNLSRVTGLVARSWSIDHKNMEQEGVEYTFVY